VKTDPAVVIVHDYLTQRGGAERVVLSMLRAFPDAPLYTALYLPEGTFPEFAGADIRPLSLNRLPPLRRNHRLALPLLASAFSSLRIRADVVVCSSSGWAHGTRVEGRKIVYCYTPAHWLYQGDRYLGNRQLLAGVALRALRPGLVRWDRRAAATAHRYLTLSGVVRDRIRKAYGIEAQVVPPPHGIRPGASRRPIGAFSPRFFLCVSRLLPYKNVGPIVAAFAGLPDETLVVVGVGPQDAQLRAGAGPNVHFAGRISDEELRWLYANCKAVLSASYEDFGLTPLEAAVFGKPSIVLRWGGFIDTVIESRTGVFFETPDKAQIRAAIQRFKRLQFEGQFLREHANHYSEPRFIAELRRIVGDGAREPSVENALADRARTAHKSSGSPSGIRVTKPRVD
jgi:glycosyltransferase involved in cell wall biosynthesis